MSFLILAVPEDGMAARSLVPIQEGSHLSPKNVEDRNLGPSRMASTQVIGDLRIRIEGIGVVGKKLASIGIGMRGWGLGNSSQGVCVAPYSLVGPCVDQSGVLIVQGQAVNISVG